MCVKEFYGFNCGHCSIPYLRRCPLTLSNEQFPPCSLPAERPIFTNDNCHACSRVIWNARVLEEEAEHRSRHERGECYCETIFRTSDHEEGQGVNTGHEGQRLRPRTRSNKGKCKEASPVKYGTNYERQMTSTSQIGLSGGENGMDGEGYAAMDPINNQSQYSMLGVAVYPRSQDQMIQNAQGQFELASYEYVGYTYGGASQINIDQAQTGEWLGFPDNGYIPQGRLSTSQTILGRPGAGMKWYPEQNLPALPAPVSSPPLIHPKTFGRVPRVWQRKAKSEPAKGEDASPPEFKTFSIVENMEVGQAPMIVSSDMANDGMS